MMYTCTGYISFSSFAHLRWLHVSIYPFSKYLGARQHCRLRSRAFVLAYMCVHCWLVGPHTLECERTNLQFHSEVKELRPYQTVIDITRTRIARSQEHFINMGHGEGKGQTDTKFEDGGNSKVREMLNESNYKTVSKTLRPKNNLLLFFFRERALHAG